MRVSENTLRMIVRQVLLENIEEVAVTRIDPKADRMVRDIRGILGEEEFVASVLARISPSELKRILRSIASDRQLKVDGIQYV